jgi:hypothetical protein
MPNARRFRPPDDETAPLFSGAKRSDDRGSLSRSTAEEKRKKIKGTFYFSVDCPF